MLSKGRIAVLVLLGAIVLSLPILEHVLLGKRSVTVSSDQSAFTLKHGDTTVADVNQKTTLELRDGEYCATATDSSYEDAPVCFTVFEADKEVELHFNYTEKKLASMLDPELEAIHGVVRDRYAAIIDNYTICRGALVGLGDWYTGVLTEKTFDPASSHDAYRFIMHREEKGWQLVQTPVIVVSKSVVDARGIPPAAIVKANTQKACDADGSLEQPLPDSSTFPTRKDSHEDHDHDEENVPRNLGPSGY